MHPAILGPHGEDLAVDVAVLGGNTTERVLMIVSGTHGVEGYAGSGCQAHLLHSGLLRDISKSVQVVLVHAVNPYGFAYNRRTNEDNIDINRNFIDFSAPLPVNPNYAECAREFLGNGKQLSDYQAAVESLDAAAQIRGGYQFFKSALQPGQYVHPEGLYFGGSSPCWSNQVFMRICQRYLSQATRAAVIDIHTGLGPLGAGELIFVRKDAAEKYAHHFTPPVSCAGGRASLAVDLTGPLVNAACDQVRGNMAICCVLEFGTVPVEDNVKAMVFENWTHRHFSPDDPLYQESTRHLRSIYYLETSSWKQCLIDRCADVIGRLQDLLVT